jgi:2-haloacid dehalogenase
MANAVTGIDHVVFDIGNVLLAWDRERPYRALIPDSDERQWFLCEVCSPEWVLEQDRGRSWAEGEALLIARYPGRSELIRAFRRQWHDMITGVIAESRAVLEEFLAEGRDVTLLTNFAADTFAECLERFPFLKQPRGVTVSAHVGLVKPEPAIYRRHVDDFALEPSRTLFIDDVVRNIEGARAQGWRGLHYRGPGTLRQDLARLFQL